jgi:hypothetical protein
MQMQLVVRQFLSLKKAERVQAETKMKEERSHRTSPRCFMPKISFSAM